MAEVREAPVSASPEDMLRAAYPRRLQRARAMRWLSFIAWRSPARQPFGWWQVPLWLDRGRLQWPRRLVATALVWVGFGLALGPIPGLGTGEVVGLLKEYLSALIEFSPLKDTFAGTEKLGKEAEPPSAADVVVPDPARLDAAAVAQARQEVANSPVSDPARLKSLIDEGGVAGAVAVANQTRYLQENATGPCDGCAQPDSGSGSSNDDHPDEPPVDPIP